MCSSDLNHLLNMPDFLHSEITSIASYLAREKLAKCVECGKRLEILEDEPYSIKSPYIALPESSGGGLEMVCRDRLNCDRLRMRKTERIETNSSKMDALSQAK